MKRRLLTLLLAGLLGLGLTAGAPTAASAGDNAAIVVNTKDGTTVFKVAFAIRHVMGDVAAEPTQQPEEPVKTRCRVRSCRVVS